MRDFESQAGSQTHMKEGNEDDADKGPSPQSKENLCSSCQTAVEQSLERNIGQLCSHQKGSGIEPGIYFITHNPLG